MQWAPKDSVCPLLQRDSFLDNSNPVIHSQGYLFIWVIFLYQHFFSGDCKTTPVSILSINLFEMLMPPCESASKISFSEHSEPLYWSIGFSAFLQLPKGWSASQGVSFLSTQTPQMLLSFVLFYFLWLLPVFPSLPILEYLTLWIFAWYFSNINFDTQPMHLTICPPVISH